MPFVAAIVDDPDTGETQLVIQFEDEGYTAALSLDTIINDEDIEAESHGQLGGKYDRPLRAALWDE